MRTLKLPGWLGLIGLLICGLLLLPLARSLPAQPAPLIEPYLAAGQLAEGEAAMLAWLKTQPNDDKARFSLGMVQALRGVERLSQSLYQYGVREDSLAQFFPILRLPVPQNKKPQTISYDNARQVIQTWNQDLAQAAATLALVKNPQVKVPLRVGMMKLDINGDGKVSPDETFWRIFARVTGIQATEKQAQSFLISFDTGDAAWLQGYCNLLGAMGEVILAHDWKTWFESTAHLFFVKPQSPYGFLNQSRPGFSQAPMTDFMDVIALIHLTNFAVVEPTRMQTALKNLQQTLALSRQSWQFILAETDNDREWLPNAKQTGVIPNIRVSQAIIDGWLTFVGEAETLLNGTQLIPFWRGREPQGLNLQRVFTEPRPFDLVSWVQGTAAAPYLEKGKLTNPGTWDRLLNTFGGDFFLFATWFN